jgi:hypothetical protein
MIRLPFQSITFHVTSTIGTAEEGFRMNPEQTTLVDSSRSTQQFQSAVSQARDETEVAEFVDGMCAKGDWLFLRAQQHVPLPSAGKVIGLKEGMLAIDAMPAMGCKRRFSITFRCKVFECLPQWMIGGSEKEDVWNRRFRGSKASRSSNFGCAEAA